MRPACRFREGYDQIMFCRKYQAINPTTTVATVLTMIEVTTLSCDSKGVFVSEVELFFSDAMIVVSFLYLSYDKNHSKRVGKLW